MPKFLDCLRRDREVDIIRELKLLMANGGQFDWQPKLDEIPVDIEKEMTHRLSHNERKPDIKIEGASDCTT